MIIDEIKALIKEDYPTKGINHPEYDGYTDGYNSAIRDVLLIVTENINKG